MAKPPEIVMEEGHGFVTVHPQPKGGTNMAGKGGGGGIPDWLQTPVKWGLLLIVASVAMSNIDAIPRAINNLFCGFGASGACENVALIDKRRAERATMFEAPSPAFSRQPGYSQGGGNRAYEGRPTPQRRTMQVQGVDRTPPPCAGQLRRDETSNAWVCRTYH